MPAARFYFSLFFPPSRISSSRYTSIKTRALSLSHTHTQASSAPLRASGEGASSASVRNVGLGRAASRPRYCEPFSRIGRRRWLRLPVIRASAACSGEACFRAFQRISSLEVVVRGLRRRDFSSERFQIFSEANTSGSKKRVKGPNLVFFNELFTREGGGRGDCIKCVYTERKVAKDRWGLGGEWRWGGGGELGGGGGGGVEVRKREYITTTTTPPAFCLPPPLSPTPNLLLL